MALEREDVIEYFSGLFLEKIMRELDTFDVAGLPVDQHVLDAFSISLKKEMSRQKLLVDKEIIEEAIDNAFNKVTKLRQPKH